MKWEGKTYKRVGFAQACSSKSCMLLISTYIQGAKTRFCSYKTNFVEAGSDPPFALVFYWETDFFCSLLHIRGHVVL